MADHILDISGPGAFCVFKFESFASNIILINKCQKCINSSKTKFKSSNSHVSWHQVPEKKIQFSIKLERTVNDVLNESPFVEWHVRFTTVLFKPLLNQEAW